MSHTPLTAANTTASSSRRILLRRGAALTAVGLAAGLSACASMQKDPVQVNVVGVESLPGQGLEMRMAVKLRVLNPNDTPIDFDGVYVNLQVRDIDFASGASGDKGTVPRFGETVLVVPISVPITAAIRQAISFATGDRSKVSYALKGKLSGPSFGGFRFDAKGEFELPQNFAK